MLCRLCLTESSNYINIYGTTNERKLQISEIIWKYIQVQIKEKDTISNAICRCCWQQLYEFHQFCLNIIEKQKVLQRQHQEPTKKVEEEPFDYNDDLDIKNVPLYHIQADEENERTSPLIRAPKVLRKSRKTEDGSSCRTDFKKAFVTKTNLAETQPDACDPLLSETNVPSVTKKQKASKKKNLQQTKDSKDCDALFEKQIYENSSETKDRIFVDFLLETSPETDDGDDFNWPMATTDTETKKRKLREQSHKKEKKGPYVPKKKCETFKSTLQLPPHMVYTDAEMDAIIAQHASLSCCICDENLLDFHHMKRHYRDKHQCEGYVNCCTRRFRGRTDFVDHLKTHSDPNFISCLICQKSLADRNALRKHIGIYHPQEEQLKYECNKCSRRFTKDYMLRQHIKSHHPPDEDMKYMCKSCGKKFARTNLLRQHVNEKHKPPKRNTQLTKAQPEDTTTTDHFCDSYTYS